jgi:hypothetical protein
MRNSISVFPIYIQPHQDPLSMSNQVGRFIFQGRFLDRRDDINYLRKLYCCPRFKTFIMLPFKTFIVEKLILDLAI